MVDMLTLGTVAWSIIIMDVPPEKDLFCLTNKHHRKMNTAAKNFRTLSAYMILNKYHWCLWKGILFLTHKTTVSNIYGGYSRETTSSGLGTFLLFLGLQSCN